MRRVVVTGSEGEHFEPIVALTAPRMEKYAKKHGAEFLRVPFPPIVDRPSSWKKLIAIALGFIEFDEVLWLDADVVIVDSTESIFDSVPADYDHAMVRHSTSEGDVPNAGVWLLRRQMLPVLSVASMMDSLRDHRWWEQAAILSLMGFTDSSGFCRHEQETHVYQHTHWLDESWNVWPGSPEGVRPRFRHACGISHGDRLNAIRRWIDASAT